MDLTYKIKRSSRRKRLSITIERDRSVFVHAPASTSEDKIREVVESKRQWIFEKTKHAQKYTTLPHPPGKELVNGESALYLGRHYKIEIIQNGLNQIRFEDRFLIPAALSEKKGRTVLRDWYIDQAKNVVIQR